VNTHPVQKKREQYFVHNFHRFKCTIVILGRQHRESNDKLLTRLFSASPNQCCCFIWTANKMHGVIKQTGQKKQ